MVIEFVEHFPNNVQLFLAQNLSKIPCNGKAACPSVLMVFFSSQPE